MRKKKASQKKDKKLQWMKQAMQNGNNGKFIGHLKRGGRR